MHNHNSNLNERSAINDNIIISLRFIPDGKAAKAFADVTFGSDMGEFTLSGFKVIEKDGNPPWVAMPEFSLKQEDGTYKRYQKFFPSRIFRQHISELILSKYQK